MSLFGDDDSPPARTKQAKSSLFDEDKPSHSRGGSSLFADDMQTDDTPWGMPTPKKAGRKQIVRNLLSSADIPESYVDTFDSMVASDSKSGSGISLDGVKQLLNSSGLPTYTQDKILGIVLPSGEDAAANEGIGRAEFNVLLALVGLSQEGEEPSLDGVDERRRNLPEPSLALPALKSRKSDAPGDSTQGSSPTSTKKQESARQTPSKPNGQRKPSFGYDADPWGSPDMHRGHNHVATNGNSSTPPTNGSLPRRTTSAFTTNSASQDSTTGGGATRPSAGGEGGWATFTGTSTGSLGFPETPNESGFGAPPSGDGSSGSDPTGLGRPLPSQRVASSVEETITITRLPEKEGMFMFQHRNYEVTSARRNSTVIRRYSDFVWLLDCLHKRYPFRQLPLLPPKRVAINGNYIAADASFVEKRRRGLARFSNTLVRHPVLREEQLVTMFFSVPTELAVWRKQATISVQEEFLGKPLPAGLEDSLPSNLEELFESVRSGVRRSAETYINLCNQIERLTKRKEGIAAEYQRVSMGLQSLTEASSDTYAVDTNDVPMLNEGLKATAKHLSSSQSLLEDEAKAWDEGVLEDLKKQRDCLVSARNLFDRRDRYDKDNIPQLEKRIKSNEDKLQVMRGRPEGTGKPGDIEKVEDAILKDKQSIVAQHARHIFVKECIRDELRFFQGSQYAVSKLHQDWAQERVKYAELQADNWRALAEEVDGMPVSEA